MEDSGREKLQGQSPDAVADDAMKKVEAQTGKVDFDSTEIDKNKKVEQFENIEGAEERARAAERAKEDAKRAAEKAKEKAEKLQAKADETPLQKKARHKRNWIIALIILLILGLIGIFAFCKLKEASKTSDDYIEETYKISSEARRILGEKKQNSFDEAKEYYKGQIDEAKNDRKKFYIEMSFVQFLILNGAGIDESINVLKDAESLNLNEEDLEYLTEKKCELGSFYQLDEYITFCEQVKNEESDE